MEKYILLVETGADLPDDLAAQFNIQKVPMHVSFGSDTRDDGTIPIQELFSYYKETNSLPQTSGCMPHDFEQVFDRFMNPIRIVTFSIWHTLPSPLVRIRMH